MSREDLGGPSIRVGETIQRPLHTSSLLLLPPIAVPRSGAPPTWAAGPVEGSMRIWPAIRWPPRTPPDSRFPFGRFQSRDGMPHCPTGSSAGPLVAPGTWGERCSHSYVDHPQSGKGRLQCHPPWGGRRELSSGVRRMHPNPEREIPGPGDPAFSSNRVMSAPPAGGPEDAGAIALAQAEGQMTVRLGSGPPQPITRLGRTRRGLGSHLQNRGLLDGTPFRRGYRSGQGSHW
jgi:hypothetical protein